MAFDDTLIVDHIKKTHDTDLLSEREKHLVGLAVTMTRGCQICTRNRVEKARGIGLTDNELNALIAVTAAVNSGVTAATARVAFGMLEQELASDCGDACSPNPECRKVEP
jgi:AhpD family alkylhydroperoxidase